MEIYLDIFFIKMPYFHNDKINLLFIDIPGCGDYNIEFYFSNKYDISLNSDALYNERDASNNLNIIDRISRNTKNINVSLEHMSFKTILMNQHFFKIDFNNIQIITIVENPYQRLIGDLIYFNLIDINSSKQDIFNIINNYIASANYYDHNICQYKFVTDNFKRLIYNLKVLHTETLVEDMIKLGYNDFIPEGYQVFDLNNYLNNDSINLINNFYNDDFIIFNYEKIQI